MAATVPPSIVALPPTPSIDDPDNFDEEMDAVLNALPAWTDQVTALGANAYVNAQAAAASAGGAAGSAATSTEQAAISTTKAGVASDKATIAIEKAAVATTKAAEAAASAASAATILVATSTTALVLGTGPKVFEVPAGKSFALNAPLRASSASNPGKFMDGTVGDYAGTSLTMVSTSYTGDGPVNDWVIVATGQRGAKGDTGGIVGGDLTGALNTKRGTDLPTSATIDPWSTGGNVTVLTGAVLVTGLADAPQAGATRILIAAVAAPIRASAALQIAGLAAGATYTLAAGDIVDVVAETISTFRAVIRRRDGKATAGAQLVTVEVIASQSWTVPVQDFEIEMCGGGQNGRSSGDHGGACGAYARKRFTGATVGSVASITIGAAGAATSSGTRNNGGASSFTLTGFTAVTCGGGTDTGATATGGDLNIDGVRGSPGYVAGSTLIGGVLNTFGRAGSGADGMLGNGAPANMGNAVYQAAGYGSGGSSGTSSYDVNGNEVGYQSGSAGRPGICRIRYWI